MALETKVCGMTDAAAIDAAIAGGADYVGFVFYPPSPRSLSFEQAASLAARVGNAARKVAVLVEPDDALLQQLLQIVPVDLLQLHGAESPKRVADVRARWKVPVMKAVPVARSEDLAVAADYEQVADHLLFDAKPPREMKEALPGGNALSFDWRLLADRRWHRPWMLSGGLSVENLRQAVEISRARAVDASSGVEERPGLKDPAKVLAFLDLARQL